MKITSEQEMLTFGESFVKDITKQTPGPIVIELVGDVGTGKTTFARGLAKGLGIKEEITSPSFTISKSYAFKNNKNLVHYDFYRLPSPGLMADDLTDNLKNRNNIIVIEWGEEIANLLPENHIKIAIDYNDDGTREVKIS